MQHFRNLISVEHIENDRSFILLTHPHSCKICGGACQPLGFDAPQMFYRCDTCHSLHAETLSFTPLFAQSLVDLATHQHFEIDCPYCDRLANYVGGSTTEGYHFVCEDRCHCHQLRTIRRF